MKEPSRERTLRTVTGKLIWVVAWQKKKKGFLTETLSLSKMGSGKEQEQDPKQGREGLMGKLES